MPARVIVAIGARATLATLLRAMAYAVTSNPDRKIDAIGGVNFITCCTCIVAQSEVLVGCVVVIIMPP